jgi:hypothetical protein
MEWCAAQFRRGAGGHGKAPAPALLEYAAALQRRLGGPRVELVGFVSGPVDGATGTNELLAPCALRALEPWAVGGTAMLLLNRASELVKTIAQLFVKAGDSALSDALLELGRAMLDTGSAPILSMNGIAEFAPNRLLNCGNFMSYIWPVPFRRPFRMRGRPELCRIWPDRTVLESAAAVQPGVFDKTVDTAEWRAGQLQKVVVETAGDRWALRDSYLQAELEALLHQRGRGRLWGGGSGQLSQAEVGGELLTYAPNLPVLLLAALRDAPLDRVFNQLASRDRLFALGVYYTIPMYDRTGTLAGPLRVKIL